MRRCSLLSVGAALMLLSAGSLWAVDEVKEVTLKGTMECAKCELHEAEKCQNVLKVKEGEKDVLYYVMDKADSTVGKDYHKNVCHAPKADVSVTGVVGEKDGKKTIEASKIE